MYSTDKRTWFKALFRVPLVILLALAMLPVIPSGNMPVVQAQPIEGTDYEIGSYCVQNYVPGAVCTANDVRIKNITPSIADLCVGAGDTITANFQAEILTGATERYDIGLYVGLDGGSALSGSNCYHDFLQEASVSGPWDLLSGLGPFKSLETKPAEIDVCADTLQNDGSVFYNFQVPVTIACIDTNQDGIADPFSTCTSWDNNSNTLCNNVKQAIPGTGSKCWCGDVESTPPIIFYSGADWGDLPDTYGTLGAGGGPRHAVQDPQNLGTPATITSTTPATAAIWLGPTVDYSNWAEGDGLPSADAKGDDSNTTDDEDGITAWVISGSSLSFSAYVNSTTGSCPGCRLGFWIDWNGDGDFADADESYERSVAYGANAIGLTIPIAPESLPPMLYVRFRLYHGDYTGSIMSTGLVANGEVEDYRFVTPTDARLISFAAIGANGSVLLRWETASELSNLGFNVYRATSADERSVKLNAALIPSLVPPGSPFGAMYQYTDSGLKNGKTYYYWLEIVDIYGTTGVEGPVQVWLGSWLGKPLPPLPWR